MSVNRRVIVIGALSTIAMHACRLLAAEGAALALLARNESRLNDLAQDLRVRGAVKVATFALDLEACPDPASALTQASDAIGGADVITIFYGYLGDQARAETDPAEAQRIISANFASASAWALTAADLLARQAKPTGVLLGISSVAGDRGRRSNYVYGAAKAGFSVLMQGIAHRFAALPNGPEARLIKFGFVDTAMTAGITKGGPLWTSADDAAKCVLRAFDHGGPIVYAPWFWRWIMLVIRCLPAPLFNRMNI
jgi:decaprenylphospho-beta-D-erythro-pentofuranosid-2-ulose 2-reductase